MSAVARRYARAAVGAAREKGGAKDIEALSIGLKTFCELLRTSRELFELLMNPALHDHQEATLRAVLVKLGLSAETVGLVRLLADRRRIDLIDDVVREVEAIADEGAGRVRAYVTSPMSLTEAQTARIAAALERRLGRSVVVSVDIDPELLGGLVCHVGDLTLDSSVRRQLVLLREQLGHRAH